MLFGDFVFLLLGIFLGYLLAMNSKEWKEQKTYDQLDEELRKELEFYKNTCASQKSMWIFTSKRLCSGNKKLKATH